LDRARPPRGVRKTEYTQRYYFDVWLRAGAERPLVSYALSETTTRTLVLYAGDTGAKCLNRHLAAHCLLLVVVGTNFGGCLLRRRKPMS